MKNKIIIPILILMVFFSVPQIVNAVIAAPSPICEITAMVLEVDKTKTTIPPMEPPEEIEYYEVKLQILEISTYRQEGTRSCDNTYIEVSEQSGQILTLAEYDKNPIKEKQKIKAKIHFGGDEWFGGYFLSDIQILEDIITEEEPKVKSAAEVSAMLIEQKQLSSVQSIQLKHEEEKPMYELVGVRKAKLLFFIPISLKIRLEVNAVTGQIVTIKKPWWSFLVF